MVNICTIRLSTSFLRHARKLRACALLVQLLVAFTANCKLVVGAETGACGGANAVVCDPPYCCSKFYFCNSGASCAKNSGCWIEWSSIGSCFEDTRTGSSPPGVTTPQCGSLTVGSKKCDNNLCCSRNGQCGTGEEYCYKGCQSQCRLTPTQITGIAFGALGGLAVLCAVAFLTFKCYLVHQGRKSVIRPNFDPVHRLYPADTTRDENASLDIVFCHGLTIGALETDAWKNTWLTRQEPFTCWAEEWLGNNLQGKARVFSLEYDGNISSDPKKKGHNSDVSEIAENLLQCIFGHSYEIGQSRAVVLIGHSFGGLVIKSLVVEAQRLAQLQCPPNAVERDHARKCKNFLDNMERGGIIFYAVPHSGAHNLEAYIRKCDSLIKWNTHRNNSHSLLSNIRDFSRDMETLSVKFETFVRPNKERRDAVIIYAFTEALPMTQADTGIIVEHASAIRLSGNSHYKVESANHMTVCRPFKREDESYQRLLSVLKVIQEQVNNHSFGNSRTAGPELGDHSKESGRTDVEAGLGEKQQLFEGEKSVTFTKKSKSGLRSKPSDVLPR